MTESDWLGVAFTVTNSLRALMYVPQLRVIAASTSGATDVALSTWWMFAANNALGALYCTSSLGEYGIGVSFLAAFVGCMSVIGLTISKRRIDVRFRTEGADRPDVM